MSPAGLLRGLTAACEGLAAVLYRHQQQQQEVLNNKQQQQQQQQQQHADQVSAQLVAPATACSLLDAWTALLKSRACSKRVPAQELAPATAASCRLAVVWPHARRIGCSSSSSLQCSEQQQQNKQQQCKQQQRHCWQQQQQWQQQLLALHYEEPIHITL
jgi:hypothetical protein